MPESMYNIYGEGRASTVSDEVLSQNRALMPQVKLGVSQYLHPDLYHRFFMPMFEKGVELSTRLAAELKDDEDLTVAELKQMGLEEDVFTERYLRRPPRQHINR